MPVTPSFENDLQKVSTRARTLWRLHGVLWMLGVSVVAFPIAGLVGARLDALQLCLSLVGVAWLISALLLIVALPGVQWRQWRYALDTHELFLQRGIFVIRRTLVPLIRIQNVDTVQGPLARRLGLSSVTVSTAAGTHTIPALTDEAAARLRARLSALVREAGRDFD